MAWKRLSFSPHCREAELRITAVLAPEAFDPNIEYATFQSTIENEGAIVTFVGVARPYSGTGGEVTCLFLDHHPRLTQQSLREIADDAAQRFDASAIRVVHRCGNVAPGEAIVFVAASAIHRRAAFEAAEYAMDRLKTEAVFWKREDAVDGSSWVEPTLADQVNRARWGE
jgi:molybdopterin synthase catalytic subunit